MQSVSVASSVPRQREDDVSDGTYQVALGLVGGEENRLDLSVGRDGLLDDMVQTVLHGVRGRGEAREVSEG
jgi:hypothetical protein